MYCNIQHSGWPYNGIDGSAEKRNEIGFLKQVFLPGVVRASGFFVKKDRCHHSPLSFSEDGSGIANLSGVSIGKTGTAFDFASSSVPCGESLQFRDRTLVRIHGKSHPRWLVVGAEPPVAGLWKELVQKIRLAGRNAWTLLDILAGLPLLMRETAGEFIPQMLDMEALGGLCFTKGCHPGQEVISRPQYGASSNAGWFRPLRKAESFLLPVRYSRGRIQRRMPERWCPPRVTRTDVQFLFAS